MNMFVYLDNNSTTRQYDSVTKEMLKMMEDDYGNPSSLHRLGVTAERSIKNARKSIAWLIGADEGEIYFTGGGTEADNTSIFGAVDVKKRYGKKIVTSRIEHPAVLESCKRLEQNGFIVKYIDADEKGRINLDQLKNEIDGETILISIMYVNNELGTIEPIKDIGDMVADRENLLLHSDAVQALGKLKIDVKSLGADLLSMSAHKIHGPKGCGALYIRKNIQIPPLLYGGGQERGFRSGTENTPALVGFGIAADIIRKSEDKRLKHLTQVRSYLLNGIKTELKDVMINSPEPVYDGSVRDETVCSPAVLNVSFLGCRGEVLLHYLEQSNIYVSTGAACSSKKKQNHVLTSIGYKPERIESAIRFSFSEFNTVEEMDYVLVELKKAVAKMRSLKRRSKGEVF